jgi:hypothetical protein
MPVRLSSLFAVLFLVQPATAQDLPDSANLLTLYTNRCAAVAADPDRALQAAFGSDGGGGATTADKALLNYSETLPLNDDVFGNLFYNRVITKGGQQSTCFLSVTAFGIDSLPYEDLPAVIEAQVETLLGGPVTKHGSPVLQGDQRAQMYLWTAGEGFPAPRALQVMQMGNVVTIAQSTLTPN